eukprot:TRINITY_DN3730_c0_g3_i2.p2 TRINITY_DN3730_c0_g3~~TRINITY_DN3730_c0_g3_i2.p2  ORF type:complete len:194 (-),score=22.23 TRINITY_DN3730_c0_g3_i2:1517-2098(-)
MSSTIANILSDPDEEEQERRRRCFIVLCICYCILTVCIIITAVVVPTAIVLSNNDKDSDSSNDRDIQEIDIVNEQKASITQQDTGERLLPDNNFDGEILRYNYAYDLNSHIYQNFGCTFKNTGSSDAYFSVEVWSTDQEPIDQEFAYLLSGDERTETLYNISQYPSSKYFELRLYVYPEDDLEQGEIVDFMQL